MTSPTLRVLVERVVAGLFPSIPVRDRSKADILAEVLAKHGWPAVLAVGAELRLMADHPVVQGVVATADPRAVLERWILLERFSHSDNRVEVVDASATHLTLRHVAGDGGVIPAANDLFVWGLLLSLFDLAGASDLRASFGRAESIALAAAPGAMTRSGGLPAETHVATFRWMRGSSEVPALPARALAGEGSLRARLHRLVRRDPLVRWTLSQAAQDLRVPARSLQRGLRAEKVTFSETVQRARVAVAERLLGDARLTLAEVAFCSGFADHAHFTRIFRRFVGVPPGALRRTLGQGHGGRTPGASASR